MNEDQTLPLDNLPGRPHEKLKVWQEGISLVKAVYQETARLPESEKYGLSSQARRAAVSVPANIAEGAARKSGNEVARYLYISRGSLSELETLIIILRELELLTQERAARLLALCREEGILLDGLVRSVQAGGISEEEYPYGD